MTAVISSIRHVHWNLTCWLRLIRLCLVVHNAPAAQAHDPFGEPGDVLSVGDGHHGAASTLSLLSNFVISALEEMPRSPVALRQAGSWARWSTLGQSQTAATDQRKFVGPHPF